VVAQQNSEDVRWQRKMVTRREFFASGAAVAVVGLAPELVPSIQEPHMYGLIARIQATPGQRDALVSILVEGSSGMPGCLSYVVARDSGDLDSLWVTEVWESQASHEASLSLPSVQEAMAAGRPLIARFSERTVTEPVGGYGFA